MPASCRGQPWPPPSGSPAPPSPRQPPPRLTPPPAPRTVPSASTTRSRSASSRRPCGTRGARPPASLQGCPGARPCRRSRQPAQADDERTVRVARRRAPGRGRRGLAGRGRRCSHSAIWAVCLASALAWSCRRVLQPYGAGVEGCAVPAGHLLPDQVAVQPLGEGHRVCDPVALRPLYHHTVGESVDLRGYEDGGSLIGGGDRYQKPVSYRT